MNPPALPSTAELISTLSPADMWDLEDQAVETATLVRAALDDWFVEQLAGESRKSQRAIAREVGRDESTVRERIRRLEREGRIDPNRAKDARGGARRQAAPEPSPKVEPSVPAAPQVEESASGGDDLTSRREPPPARAASYTSEHELLEAYDQAVAVLCDSLSPANDLLWAKLPSDDRQQEAEHAELLIRLITRHIGRLQSTKGVQP